MIEAFDEKLYLLCYPDVAEAVLRGEFSSGHQHFSTLGEKEGRLAKPPQDFDAEFYLATNPDVAAAISDGHFVSAEHHWIVCGKGEGRPIAPPPLRPEFGWGIFSPSTFRYPYIGARRVPGFGFAPYLPDPSDAEIVLRLVRSFKAAMGERPGTRGEEGVWQVHQKINAPILKAIEEEDIEFLVRSLGVMFQSHITHGLAMGRAAAANARRAPDKFGVQFGDRLLRLAEAVGAAPIRSPEQGDYSRELDIDPEVLVTKIEKKLGVNLDFPQVGAPYGGKVNGKIFPDLSLTHLYAAYRIRQQLQPGQARKAFEIGGGFGGLALFLQR